MVPRSIKIPDLNALEPTTSWPGIIYINENYSADIRKVF